ncbi:MAG: hypothetical protein ACLQFR_07615 [Streptosporangiaceae bacterium]
MPETGQTLLAQLTVQDERIAAVNAAATLADLEDIDQRFAGHAVLAADPAFAAVYLEAWRNDD